ncbi:hypothetical protein JCM10213_002305 [Rhodosporidiobolus nylandii]
MPAAASAAPAPKKRGRKQDSSLPPSRSREIQRAFRARRAGLLSNLEARVLYLEAEVVELRRRLQLDPDGEGVSGATLSLTDVDGEVPGCDIGRNVGTKTAKRARTVSATSEDGGGAGASTSRRASAQSEAGWGNPDEAMGQAAEVLGGLGRAVGGSAPPALPPPPAPPPHLQMHLGQQQPAYYGQHPPLQPPTYPAPQLSPPPSLHGYPPPGFPPPVTYAPAYPSPLSHAPYPPQPAGPPQPHPPLYPLTSTLPPSLQHHSSTPAPPSHPSPSSGEGHYLQRQGSSYFPPATPQWPQQYPQPQQQPYSLPPISSFAHASPPPHFPTPSHPHHAPPPLPHSPYEQVSHSPLPPPPAHQRRVSGQSVHSAQSASSPHPPNAHSFTSPSQPSNATPAVPPPDPAFAAQRSFLLRSCGPPPPPSCCISAEQRSAEEAKYAAFRETLVEGAMEAAHTGRLRGSLARGAQGAEDNGAQGTQDAKAKEGENAGELCCGGLVDCSDTKVFDPTPSFEPSAPADDADASSSCCEGVVACAPADAQRVQEGREEGYLPIPAAFALLARYMLPPSPSPPSASSREPTPQGIAQMLFDSFPSPALTADEPPAFALEASKDGGQGEMRLKVRGWKVEMARKGWEIRRLVVEEGVEEAEARKRRKKENRNARVKKRLRYDKSQKKLGSMQAQFKGGEARTGYEGETSGLSRRNVKSRKLG